MVSKVRKFADNKSTRCIIIDTNKAKNAGVLLDDFNK
jgi:hypothetical protein